MVTMEARRWGLRLFRKLLIAGGGAMMLAALIADRTGWGVPGSVGIGQVLLFLIGCAVLLTGALGRRIATLHRASAVIILNTLIFFACLELASMISFRIGSSWSLLGGPLASSARLPYYRAQEWSREFWSEQTLQAVQVKRYRPYALWRGVPIEGRTIHVDENGIRWTPGADCGVDAYHVFAFGGSTMRGWGSPDWGTITAYIQSRLAALKDQPVCVVNFGQDAFVSTQSLIELLMQLQARRTPDLVIFYDGINEVHAAYESGQPHVHANFMGIASKFEGREHPLVAWFKSSRQFSLLTSMAAKLSPERLQSNPTVAPYRTMGIDTARLANLVVQTYLGNYRIVSALAQEYGFEYFFFWQPAISVSKKPLTLEEQEIRSTLAPSLVELYQAVYQDVQQVAPAHPNLRYIARVLDNQDSQIWIDHWSHVTPVGNKLIAEAMLNVIEDSLQSTGRLQSDTAIHEIDRVEVR